jgi:hypothetical protein
MVYLFVLCILIGNLDISFDVCNIFSYLSRCEYGCIMFCIVLRVLNVIFIAVSSKSFVIIFVSFPIYVKAARFVFWCCGSVSSCCSCEAGCFLI